MAYVIPQVDGFVRSAWPVTGKNGEGTEVAFTRNNVTVYVTELDHTAPYGCWSADWRGVDTINLDDDMADEGHVSAAQCRAEIDAACEDLLTALGDWPKNWVEFTLA